MSLGHKLGIDATRKTAGEGYARVWPPDITMDAPTRDHVLPRRMGGKLWRRNKVLVCTRCNSDKRGGSRYRLSIEHE